MLGPLRLPKPGLVIKTMGCDRLINAWYSHEDPGDSGPTGINGRLPVLLRWLNESRPGIVCLQEPSRAPPQLCAAPHDRVLSPFPADKLSR